MTQILDYLLSTAMIFGPTIGYFDQYRIIWKSKTSLGFSSVTCAILCFANILRIYFWLGMRFDTTLLLQSIAMLTAILLLLHIVIKYKPKDLPFTPLIRNNSSSSYSSISDSSITSDTGLTEIAQKVELKWYQRTFWDWDHFRDYVGCLSAFAAVVGVFYLLLHQYQIFISILGFLSLGIESTLPVPQLLTNFKYRNTSGFSLVILGTWFLGDSFKAFYFFYNDSPVQFVVCAIIQLSFDTMIVLQFIVFSNPVKKRLGIRSIELPNDV